MIGKTTHLLANGTTACGLVGCEYGSFVPHEVNCIRCRRTKTYKKLRQAMPKMAVDSTPAVLLIDADNISPSLFLQYLPRLGRSSFQASLAFGNWNRNILNKTWSNLFAHHSISPVNCSNITKGKNAADIELAIAAMDHYYQGVRTFYVFSSDCDYLPLVTRLTSDPSVVYFGFGERKTALLLLLGQCFDARAFVQFTTSNGVDST